MIAESEPQTDNAIKVFLQSSEEDTKLTLMALHLSKVRVHNDLPNRALSRLSYS